MADTKDIIKFADSMTIKKHRNLNQDLLDAVIANQPSLVLSLLEQGADPNYTEDDAQLTPLHYAALYESVDVVSVLIGAGAKVHTLSANGEAALTLAKKNGNKALINALIQFSYANQDDHRPDKIQ